ncbi:metallophosphoesterase [Raineyella fluvialis]|uniref:Calcineurin-like phosphoesterase domain-containing protein n=1 Tax=Raineyella fluvialis TaxID=2662261 RepID=A0A5Q2FH70_9ACTN|nr:metallophosphoesterase [Raineyella fluvialis]QGF24894.1 hypothetical protein Rai3103_16140 [Raineyella fluvialis]
MRVRRLGIALTAAALLAAAPSGIAPHAIAAPSATNQGQHRGQGQDYSMAVIGDVPYGSAQIAAFPTWIDQINADPDVRFVTHVGDIKNGSSRCDDAYFQQIQTDFDRFQDPLVYTIGDNEWTDCHRGNNGAYNPLERLSALRSVFFSEPGRTNGQAVPIDSQSAAGFPENVNFERAGLDVAAVDIVGSNNDLQPWTGIGLTAPTAAQLDEERARTANAIVTIDRAFDDAQRHQHTAVAIMLQADMFDPTYTPTWNDISAFQPLVRHLVERSAAFDGEVYLFNGDSHVFRVDQPLAAGSTWLATYGITNASAGNLTRVTVDGSSNNKDWLKLTVHPQADSHVVTWERIAYQ